MSQAAIIINVSSQEQSHSNGLSGTWIVPGKKSGEKFAMLVVYPTIEIQDIGDQKRVNHWLKAAPIAKDIMGMFSDSSAHSPGVRGSKEKWGLFLCEADPDLPKSLIEAMEAEMNFLNDNPPDVKYRKDAKSKANVAMNIEAEPVKEMKEQLSFRVQALRAEFEQECRSLVQKKEIVAAERAMLMEDQRLVAEGDMMWAKPKEQHNINELHRNACSRLGQERPWCYVPQQLVDCPGCGAKIKENILSCPACHGWLDDGIEELRAMKPKERSVKMYPERNVETVPAR
jgi:hypothetical protein